MTECTPIPKETRPWVCRKGVESCTRKEPCPSCRGARNRRSGMRNQRQARKALEAASGTSAARFVGMLGNEEAWHGLPIRAEVKSGAQMGPALTRFLLAEAQSDASRAIGDTRPFVAVAMRGGVNVVMFRLERFAEVCEAMLGVQ